MGMKVVKSDRVGKVRGGGGRNGGNTGEWE